MLEVSANLNELGNPVIFGSNTWSTSLNQTQTSPYYNRVIVELNATNVAIYIYPITDNEIDAALTNTNNSSIFSSINSNTNLVATYNQVNKRFEITGNINSSIAPHWSDFYNHISTESLNFVYLIDEEPYNETHKLGITINESMFSVQQIKCTSCIDLTYLDTAYDYFNPLDNYGLAELGDVEYQYQDLNNNWVSMGIVDIVKNPANQNVPVNGSYGVAKLRHCYCDIASNLKLRAIRTVRDTITCTNEIVYQSISNYFAFLSGGSTVTSINLFPYKPEVEYGDSFNCCVSVTDSINVDIISILPKPVAPTPHACVENSTLTYNLYKYAAIDDLELIDTVVITNPTINSGYTYDETLEKGSYKLTAELCNCCACVTKEWDINICDSYIITTGDCNNPKINNISANHNVKFTIKTYNSSNIVDTISQQVILKDQLVGPLSEYQFPKLNDGFYQIILDVIDQYGVTISTTTQVLFYDCIIKSCEVELRRKLLGFNWCADCDEKKAQQKEYEDLKVANSKFEIYKDVIYSYWNDIKMQQSIPESWDIESHLQELMTYSQTFNEMNKLCESCIESSFSGNVVSSNTDCGCNS
jgi:hypothetical protein